MLLLTSPSYAGIQFFSPAMTAVPDHFDSEDEAIRYATRVKWQEDILQKMLVRLRDLESNADDPSIGWLLKGQKQEGNMYREQWKRYELAVRIMQRFKARGQKGDPAMGSSCHASSFPLWNYGYLTRGGR